MSLFSKIPKLEISDCLCEILKLQAELEELKVQFFNLRSHTNKLYFCVHGKFPESLDIYDQLDRKK